MSDIKMVVSTETGAGKATIVFVVDTTYSMNLSLLAVREAIKNAKLIFGLIKLHVIIIFYGDYGNYMNGRELRIRQEFEKVLTILDTQDVSFDIRFNQYKLNDNGGGGDLVEALNSALFYVYTTFSSNTGVIVITDACGDTGAYSNCTCSRAADQRELEIKALMKKGLTREQCTFQYIFSLLTEKKNMTVSLIKNKECKFDTLYKTSGGMLSINTLSTDFVFGAIFNTLTQILGLNPSEQKTRTINFQLPFTFNDSELKTFRDFVRRSPDTFKHLIVLSKIYYRSLKKNPEQLKEHSKFMGEISQTLDKSILKKFKEYQYSEKSLKEIQTDTTGPRIYTPETAPNATIEELFQYIYRGPGNIMDHIKKLIQSFSLVGEGHPDFSKGIPLSVIKEDMSLILSFLSRRGEYYIPNHKGYLPMLYASLLTWCGIPELKEYAMTRIQDKKFMEWAGGNATSISANYFNTGFLSFLISSFSEKLDKTKMRTLNRIWLFNKMKTLFSKKETFEVKMLLDEMSHEKILSLTDTVPMAHDVALDIPFVSSIFVKVNEPDVRRIVQNMCKHRIGTDLQRDNLLRLVREFKFVYVSTYAVNFYISPSTNKLDEYTTTNFTNLTYSVPNIYETFRKDYLEKIGRNGEHVYEMLVPRSDIVSGGPQLVLCTRRDCKNIYQVQDTSSNVIKRCVSCRTRHRQPDDRAPSGEVNTQTILCQKGHPFVISFNTESKLLSQNCAMCQIDSSKATARVECQLNKVVEENISFFSNYYEIPEDILKDFLRTDKFSTFKFFHKDEKVNPALFTKWKIEKKDTETFRADGCPLTTESFETFKELLENNLRRTCRLCYSEKNRNAFKNLCTNKRCAGEICKDCIRHQYALVGTGEDNGKTIKSFVFYTGKITAQKVQCCFCRSQITHKLSKRVSIVSVQKLKKYGFMIKLLEEGKDIWKCSSGKTCKNSTDGLFEVEKSECRAAGEEVEIKERFCEDCMILKVTKPCPGCGIRVSRIDGCCHMTCQCGQHFCWCCGEGFGTARAVYDHLDELYGTPFATEAQMNEARVAGLI